jgi:hypothetical protein
MDDSDACELTGDRLPISWFMRDARFFDTLNCEGGAGSPEMETLHYHARS